MTRRRGISNATTPYRRGFHALKTAGLTELENCVLAVIWRLGPCSAYAVQQDFAGSASSHWGASSGSIYPVVRRLEASGLVESAPKRQGRRARRDLRVSPAGLSAVRGWISALEPWTARPTFDPVRTRTFFLDAISTSDRRSFLDRAIQQATVAVRERSDAVSRLPHGSIEHVAELGTVFELKARLAWLRRAAELLQTA